MSSIDEPASEPSTAPKIVVVGAGPAGLTAAYVLAKKGVTSTVLESDTVVGGISRTAERDGWRFDIGGHRFFTKVKPVEDLWFEILGPDDFLRRPRLSRVYYRGKFYDYPIVPMNVLKNIGLIEAVRQGTRRIATETGIEPSEVAEVIGRALTANRPRARYLVGSDAKQRAVMSKLLPARVMDRLIGRALGA